jgi:hypothetical protein
VFLVRKKWLRACSQGEKFWQMPIFVRFSRARGSSLLAFTWQFKACKLTEGCLVKLNNDIIQAQWRYKTYFQLQKSTKCSKATFYTWGKPLQTKSVWNTENTIVIPWLLAFLLCSWLMIAAWSWILQRTGEIDGKG